MKVVIAFLFGATVGAVAALWYSPSSGETFRKEAQSDLHKTLQGLDERFQEMSHEMRQQIDQLRQSAHLGDDSQSAGDESAA